VGSSSAPTTTSPSHSASRSCSPASRLRCAERRRRRRNDRVVSSTATLVVDLDEHRARVRGEDVRLTPTEFRLLAYLVEHAGQLVAHRQVLSEVWGAGYDATSTSCA